MRILLGWIKSCTYKRTYQTLQYSGVFQRPTELLGNLTVMTGPETMIRTLWASHTIGTSVNYWHELNMNLIPATLRCPGRGAVCEWSNKAVGHAHVINVMYLHPGQTGSACSTQHYNIIKSSGKRSHLPVTDSTCRVQRNSLLQRATRANKWIQRERNNSSNSLNWG